MDSQTRSPPRSHSNPRRLPGWCWATGVLDRHSDPERWDLVPEEEPVCLHLDLVHLDLLLLVHSEL